MFTETFYPIFDNKYKIGFIMYSEGSLVYGKELNKILKKMYDTDSLEVYSKKFVEDINEAYREYAKVCHINIIYDSFTENMKKFLTRYDMNYTLCEIQNMTRKEIFLLFDGASMDMLYEVASNLFTYHNSNNDSHDEIF